MNPIPTAVFGPGESLRWSGAAPSGLRLRTIDALLIPFSLFWGGFAIVWESAVLASKAPFLFRLWGIPFVLVGLYLIVGRFFVDAWLRSRTSYAVTDRAAYIVRSDPFGASRRFAGSALGAISLESIHGSLGTIRLEAKLSASFMYGWSLWNGARLDAFEDIQYEPAYQAILAIADR